jgi:hypothetical protein
MHWNDRPNRVELNQDRMFGLRAIAGHHTTDKTITYNTVIFQTNEHIIWVIVCIDYDATPCDW